MFAYRELPTHSQIGSLRLALMLDYKFRFESGRRYQFISKGEMKKLKDIVLEEMYLYMENTMDKENNYPYETVLPYSNTYWKFIDRYKIIHGIRLLLGRDKIGAKDVYEIKFGIIKDGVIDFEKPQHYDDKVFNTHIKIAMDEIIKKHEEVDMYKLHPVDNDPRRSRLYKMAINKYLDAKEWDASVADDNSIWLKRK